MDLTLAFVLQLSVGKKLERLKLIAPQDAQAIEFFIDECLIRRWPTYRGSD